MAITRNKEGISADKLLEAASQLSLPELEKFVAGVISLQSHRRAPGLPKVEADLLVRINKGLPPDIYERYRALIAKREDENLTDEEYEELLHLTDQAEQVQVERLEALIELSHIRNISLDELIESLGIKPAPVQ